MIITEKKLQLLIHKTLATTYQYLVYVMAQKELGNEIKIIDLEDYVAKLNDFTRKYNKEHNI